MNRGIILYGPPAAGKDTITNRLHELDSRYVLYRRLKAGRGRTAGYRMTTLAAIEELRAKGEIVWENQRYGAVYAIDRPSLVADLANHIPVVHMGQPEGIDAVIKSTPEAKWLVVYVWCSRDVAKARIQARGTGDTAERLIAWDETPPILNVNCVINTATSVGETAAQEVDRSLAAMAI